MCIDFFIPLRVRGLSIVLMSQFPQGVQLLYIRKIANFVSEILYYKKETQHTHTKTGKRGDI